ncbi:hypothetical protein [uncultured Ruminococcus sp.]|uniref:hypothetical protein n=1 Tax=uncultured Ruminococcus sp. TaxID=165186 RepID=UPI0025D00F9D|nr:hypothetical protein [uncultured Ruminococcus sp.]
MRKKYSEPVLEVQKFSFEDILAGSLTPSTTAPTEESVPVETGGEIDPGEDW